MILMFCIMLDKNLFERVSVNTRDLLDHVIRVLNKYTRILEWDVTLKQHSREVLSKQYCSVI